MRCYWTVRCKAFCFRNLNSFLRSSLVLPSWSDLLHNLQLNPFIFLSYKYINIKSISQSTNKSWKARKHFHFSVAPTTNRCKHSSGKEKERKKREICENIPRELRFFFIFDAIFSVTSSCRIKIYSKLWPVFRILASFLPRQVFFSFSLSLAQWCYLLFLGVRDGGEREAW